MGSPLLCEVTMGGVRENSAEFYSFEAAFIYPPTLPNWYEFKLGRLNGLPFRTVDKAPTFFALTMFRKNLFVLAAPHVPIRLFIEVTRGSHLRPPCAYLPLVRCKKWKKGKSLLLYFYVGMA